MQNAVSETTAEMGRKTQISAEMRRLSGALGTAEKAVQSLGGRIESVLSPCPPTIQKEAKQPQPTSSVLMAAALSELATRMEDLGTCLQNMESRVEL